MKGANSSLPVDSLTALHARVVRYNVRLIKIARNLVPVGVLITIGAKYIGSYYALAVAVATQSALLYLFLRARSRLGAQAIVARPDRLVFVESRITLRRRSTLGWTLSQGVARVYGPSYSYRLVVAETEAGELGAALTQAFGPVTVTVRRGSLRARTIAMTVCISGLIALVVGILIELVALALVGIVLSILGGATFGALSQRVTQ